MNSNAVPRVVGSFACAIAALFMLAGCTDSFDGSGSSALRCLTEDGYPGASAEPLVMASDEPAPVSEEKAALCVAAWREVTHSSFPSLPYIVTETIETNEAGVSYVRSTVTTHDQTVVLGDVGHSSHVVATGSNEVAWMRESVGPESYAQPDLVVRNLALGTDQIVNSGEYVADVKIDGRWLVYAVWQNDSQRDGSAYNWRGAKLHAFDLDGGGRLELSDRIWVMSPANFRGMFSISNGRVVWLERSESLEEAVMSVRDLATSHKVQLAVVLDYPEDISVFGDLVVWRDTTGWRGYSLSESTMFQIPTLSLNGSVYAAPAGIEWALYQGDGQLKYYRTEVLRHR